MAPQSAVRVVDLTQVTYIRVSNCFIYLYRLHSTYFQTTAADFFAVSALRACPVSHFLFLISRFLFLRSWFYHYPTSREPYVYFYARATCAIGSLSQAFSVYVRVTLRFNFAGVEVLKRRRLGGSDKVAHLRNNFEISYE